MQHSKEFDHEGSVKDLKVLKAYELTRGFWYLPGTRLPYSLSKGPFKCRTSCKRQLLEGVTRAQCPETSGYSTSSRRERRDSGMGQLAMAFEMMTL